MNIIGHPSARRIGKRPPVDADFAELFRAGVKFSIDTDAHATGHLDFLRYGVGTAQRGWLTSDDVINTWPLDRLR